MSCELARLGREDLDVELPIISLKFADVSSKARSSTETRAGCGRICLPSPPPPSQEAGFTDRFIHKFLFAEELQVHHISLFFPSLGFSCNISSCDWLGRALNEALARNAVEERREKEREDVEQ
jgi:hypothetical protein